MLRLRPSYQVRLLMTFLRSASARCVWDNQPVIQITGQRGVAGLQHPARSILLRGRSEDLGQLRPPNVLRCNIFLPHALRLGPSSRRSPGSAASRAMASAHWPGVEASMPVTPSSISRRWIPTGLATTGNPAAMYCSTFRPHFPILHESSGSQLMPMSAAASSSASVVDDQGRSVARNRRGGAALDMSRNSMPGKRLAMASSCGSARASEGNMLCCPIQTRRTAAPTGRCSAGRYHFGSKQVGTTWMRWGSV